jgi:alkanesulfonate monooxygenase SsuD/methylene tetrahydromethanopterin reductase-like flavin-dependent oxidoreductase (luciferase family)
MITKFDSSYVGSVDLEDAGYLGKPINDRWYSNEQLADVMPKTVAYAQQMDRLGYDTLWMAEHHFQPEGTECIPNLLMMATHLCGVTRNLRIGCGFKAFNEERFSHKGKYYTLPPEVPYRGYTLKELTLVPRPLRRPVECWQPIQSGSDRAFDFMAKHGICGVIGGGSAEGGAVDRHMVEFRAAYARRGVELALGERLSLGYQFFIAESREAAMQAAAQYYEENMKMFGELRLVRAITEEQIAAMRDPRLVPGTRLPRIEDAVKAGGFLAGTPDDIIAELKAVEKRYPGLERVSCSMALGTPLSVALEQLERFAKEVMPAFGTPAARAAAD